MAGRIVRYRQHAERLNRLPPMRFGRQLQRTSPFRQVREARRYWTPAATAIVVLCLFVYVIQRTMGGTGWWTAPEFARLFGLSRQGLGNGFFWQPLTYMFLHGNLLHLILNLLVVILFGSGLEEEIGPRRFWLVFLTSGVIGGLGWLALAERPDAVCIGASGGVFGLIGAFTGLFPRRVVTPLFFPVRFQAWVLALVLGLSTLFEVITSAPDSQTAYMAHLAGGIAGFLYGSLTARKHRAARIWPLGDRGRGSARHSASRPGKPSRAFPRAIWSRWRRRPPVTVQRGTDDPDALLEKISREGLSSLSLEEQEALHRYARRGLEGRSGRSGVP